MIPLKAGYSYRVKAQKAGTDDNPRPLRFLECNHLPLGHRATCIDVDRGADEGQSTIHFTDMVNGDSRDPISFGGRTYLIWFLGSIIRYINVTDRESQLYKDDGNLETGDYLECTPYDMGNHFTLWIQKRNSPILFVGIEKFESGWYLTVSPFENAARFYVDGPEL
ncbi:hypothetical protein MVEG_12387 [Podila verticillata NRRL 6337]|uniref:Uncharacterized protein n=1 Tax=Podila verticillata NRRL 6337 TaxID=1069443 RepID=A0A086TIJ3_9FUNG|nr:hypothetical protein MVEG_12387 [Podila verticillata NRRL 6337]